MSYSSPSSRPSIALIAALIVQAGNLPARGELGASPDEVSLSASFTLDPQATDHYRGVSYPGSIFVPLGPLRPEGLRKEPTYRATPRYARVCIGDQPDGAYLLAVDEPEGERYKLYVDVNRNGDLTDDGDGSYDQAERGEEPDRGKDPESMIYRASRMMRASWGAAGGHAHAYDVGVVFRRFHSTSGRYKAPWNSFLQMSLTAGGVGTLALDGRTRKALLFTEALEATHPYHVRVLVGRPGRALTEEAARTRRLAWLFVDVNGDGQFEGIGRNPEFFALGGPFEMAGRRYESTYTADGTALTLTSSAAPPNNTLLPAGTVAPDFAMRTSDGRAVRLSDYRGKVVVLDFWGTWCGPCVQAMPHLERIQQAVKGQGAMVLAVASDREEDFRKFANSHLNDYSFQFALDPTPKDDPPVAVRLYNATGFPTVYVIDKGGNVVAAFMGSGRSDQRIEQALKALGISISGNSGSSD